MMRLSAISSGPVGAQATSTTAPVMAGVPVMLFGIVFLVVLAAFLIWYMIMRRRP